MSKLGCSFCSILSTLIFTLYLPCTSLADPEKFLPIDLNDAVMDSRGVVWGISRASREVFVYEQGAWKQVPADVGLGFEPIRLAACGDGAVVVLWGDQISSYGDVLRNSIGYRLSVHSAENFRTIARIEEKAFLTRLFVDRSNNVWLTGPANLILRINPEGEVDQRLELPQSVHRNHEEWRGENSLFNPVFVAEDEKQQLWFWSNISGGSDNAMAIRSFVRFDGKRFDQRPSIAGLPDGQLSAVSQVAPNRLWVAVKDHNLWVPGTSALFELDTVGMKAMPVSEPRPGAFQWVMQLESADDARFVFAWRPRCRDECVSHTSTSSSLWELRGTEWKERIVGLDHSHSSRGPGWTRDEQYLRPFVVSPSGLWLGGSNGGAWFLPRESGEVVLADSSKGFPLPRVDRIFRLPSGRILLIQFERGSFTVADDKLITPILAAQTDTKPDFETFRLRHPIIQAGGSFWGVRLSHPRSLSEWNGLDWALYPFPASFTPAENRYDLSEDSLGRLWFIPELGNRTEGSNEATAIFHSNKRSWVSYPSFKTALESEIKSNHELSFPGFEFPQRPRTNLKGQVVFRDRFWQVYYFDGAKWSFWKPSDIDRYPRASLKDPPFFNELGQLVVNTYRGSTLLTEANWAKTNPTSAPALPYYFQSFSSRLPNGVPVGCGEGRISSLVKDGEGMTWITAANQLYKERFGVCVRQFEAGAIHPFVDGRKVRSAKRDVKGNVILTTGNDSSPLDFVLIRSPARLPDTKLLLKRLAGDEYRLDFEGSGEGNILYSWRLNDGEWSAPDAGSGVTLRWLEAGKYMAQARAVDSSLEFDPTPATSAEFEVTVTLEEQFEHLARLLGSSDFAKRDEAVAELVKRGERALPVLNKLRATASADEQWWIDATIQRINENRVTAK